MTPSRSSRTKAKPVRKRAKPTARRKAPAPARRLRPGHLVRAALIGVTLAAGAGLAVIPVSDWFDQQAELDDARVYREELQDEIDGIQREIAAISGDAGIERRGRCFGPYVRPGAETYSIPGVSGCVELP